MKRTVGLALAGILTMGLVACSSGTAGGTLSSSSAATTTRGSEASAGSGAGGSEGGPGEPASSRPVPTTPLSGQAVVFGSPSAEVTRRFATPVRTLKGVYTSVAVNGARQAGQEVGGVAVFTFPSDKAASATFRGQIINQLVLSTGGARTVHADRVGRQKVVVSDGTGGILGWFAGRKAVVVVSGSNLSTAKAVAAAQLARH